MNNRVIYTIGYSVLEIERFRQVLSQHKIFCLVDVRTSPYSKYKPNFNKDRLSNYLNKYNIKYLFLGDQLGGMPRDEDCYDNTGKVLYEVIRSKTFFIEGIERLLKGLDNNYRLCIMCSENKPEDCHRSKLIGEVLYNKEINVTHILSDSTTINHRVIRDKFIPNQRDFFNTSLKSRKSHRV